MFILLIKTESQREGARSDRGLTSEVLQCQIFRVLALGAHSRIWSQVPRLPTSCMGRMMLLRPVNPEGWAERHRHPVYRKHWAWRGAWNCTLKTRVGSWIRAFGKPLIPFWKQTLGSSTGDGDIWKLLLFSFKTGLLQVPAQFLDINLMFKQLPRKWGTWLYIPFHHPPHRRVPRAPGYRLG